MSFAILIPAYKPDPRLVHLVEQLSQACPAPIVVVNDGSPAEHDPVFAALAYLPQVTVLTHPVNRGKGAALRTGFAVIDAMPAEITSVITADADGQHSVADILKVAAATEQQAGTMIIGSRQFDKDVPPKSMFGNTVTRWVMRLFFGIRLWDTQTGLRGIPRCLLPALIEIPYDHYELEMEMLLVARRHSVPLVEIPIETIYIEKNRASHFKPLLDSTRVYFVLFRYGISSLVTAGADYLVFILAHLITQNVPLSMLLARIVSVLVNYLLLKKWVFLSQDKIRHTFPRFVLLVAFFGVLTTLLIQVLTGLLPLTPLQAKLIIEISLYLVVFLAVKSLVFLNSADGV